MFVILKTTQFAFLCKSKSYVKKLDNVLKIKTIDEQKQMFQKCQRGCTKYQVNFMAFAAFL